MQSPIFKRLFQLHQGSPAGISFHTAAALHDEVIVLGEAEATEETATELADTQSAKEISTAWSEADQDEEIVIIEEEYEIDDEESQDHGEKSSCGAVLIFKKLQGALVPNDGNNFEEQVAVFAYSKALPKHLR